MSVTWRDAMGQVIKDDDKMMVKDTDLVIVGADWSHMGRSVPLHLCNILHTLGDVRALRGLLKVGAMDELTKKRHQNKICHHLKILTSKGTLRQVFIRVYRLEMSVSHVGNLAL